MVLLVRLPVLGLGCNNSGKCIGAKADETPANVAEGPLNTGKGCALNGASAWENLVKILTGLRENLKGSRTLASVARTAFSWRDIPSDRRRGAARDPARLQGLPSQRAGRQFKFGDVTRGGEPQ